MDINRQVAEMAETYDQLALLSDLIDNAIKEGADAADAIWVPIDDLANYKLWSETIRIINQAHEMWQKL